MSAAAQDQFEEWLHVPVPYACPDPRFEIRRASKADFDEIYDLVDEAFEFKRSRAEHDWLYRRNPGGKGRCWIIVERETGMIVGSDARRGTGSGARAEASSSTGAISITPTSATSPSRPSRTRFPSHSASCASTAKWRC